MTPARAATGMFLLGVALGGTACRNHGEPCVVTGVSVDEGRGAARLAAIGMDRDELRRIGLDAFARTPGFVVPTSEPRGNAPRCRGTISLEDGRVLAVAAGAQAEVLVRMEVSSGEDEGSSGETIRSTEMVAPGETIASTVRRAIQSGAVRGAAALALAREEARKPEAEVIRDLESADPKVRDLAVGVLADRKNTVAVPALIARLKDPDGSVADRAVGALAQIGDPRAVGPIIELSRRRNGIYVAQMVRAVGDIGGPEAEAYLETVAAGHSDPLVAHAAGEALKDARRKRSGSRTGGAR